MHVQNFFFELAKKYFSCKKNKFFKIFFQFRGLVKGAPSIRPLIGTFWCRFNRGLDDPRAYTYWKSPEPVSIRIFKKYFCTFQIFFRGIKIFFFAGSKYFFRDRFSKILRSRPAALFKNAKTERCENLVKKKESFCKI